MNIESSNKQIVLITGIAGSGKSTVCNNLIELGHEAYGIEDIEGMFAMYRKGTRELFTDFDNSDPEKIERAEWRCNVDKLSSLIAKQKNHIAFYCGVASNMDEILPLFDPTLLLKVDSSTLHQRLSNREGTDDMGNTEASRQSVLGWKDWWENEIIRKGVIVVDAQQDPSIVAKNILERFGLSTSI